MAPVQFSVTHGPGKFDLSNALFAWNPRRPVTFVVNCPVGTVVEVLVTSVQAEDGSGESWNIEGTVVTVSRQHTDRGLFLATEGQRAFIWFRTDRRQGYAKFFEKGGHKTIAELDQLVQRLNEAQFGDERPVRR